MALILGMIPVMSSTRDNRAAPAANTALRKNKPSLTLRSGLRLPK